MGRLMKALVGFLVALVALALSSTRALGDPFQGEGRAALNGLPTISDTYNPRDQGTDWPADAFTALVVGHQSPEPISKPALHSYAGDGNMEGLSAFGPFNQQENRTDLGSYTGAVGPAGGSTPEAHPEITAP
jgi:hypothetical protein